MAPELCPIAKTAGFCPFLRWNREGENKKASRVDWRRHKKWWPDPESNWGHGDFQSPALPTELSCHLVHCLIDTVNCVLSSRLTEKFSFPLHFPFRAQISPTPISDLEKRNFPSPSFHPPFHKCQCIYFPPTRDWGKVLSLCSKFCREIRRS